MVRASTSPRGGRGDRAENIYFKAVVALDAERVPPHDILIMIHENFICRNYE